MLTANVEPIREEILAAFGPQISSRPEVLERLVTYAKIFDVEAEDLHAKWEAYTLTPAAQRSDDDLTVPTLAHLDELQSVLLRKQEAEKHQALLGTSDSLLNVKEVNPFVEGTMFTSDSLQSLLNDKGADILGSLRTPAKVRRKIVPKDATALSGSGAGPHSAKKYPSQSVGVAIPKTPASSGRFDKTLNVGSSPASSRFYGASPRTPSGKDGIALSPRGPSPNAIKFADRLNKAKKEETLNEHVPMVQSSPADPVRCEISLVPGQQTSGYRYMYEKLMEKGDYLDERIDQFAELIVESIRETLPEETRNGFQLQHPGVPNQDPILTVGRVCCDSLAENAKLNEQSILLESSRVMGAGCRVKLNLNEIPGFTMFPGQIIGAEGMNSSGRLLNVSKLYQAPHPPKATSTPSQIVNFYSEEGTISKRPVNVFIANGPYTLDDSLNYEPFEEFVAQIVKEAPDVVILQGPFVDASHPMIAQGDLDVDIDELFRIQISSRLERIIQARKHRSTKIILIPSTRDACSEWVSFPQPSLAAGLTDQESRERRRVLGIPGEVMLFPNPVQFTINETVFACCSTDILWQMCAEEVARVPKQQQGSNDANAISIHKITRLFQHMLSQRSFYPLFPPALDDACLDLSRSKALELQATPDVLIAGSRLQYTTRKVNGCVCINPGLLVKGRGGGTFAKMCIWPLDLDGIKTLVKEKTTDSMDVDGEEEEDIAIGHAVEERCRVEIQRI
ncbi:hypothetical protein SpCBS45565_g00783 [Spizellomyces sp. 'palustris']|nr:hypothetical protein SpCBS45565_g00783 [Spizellomyces sp. 'palustris']